MNNKTQTAAPSSQPAATMEAWPGAFGIYQSSKKAVLLNLNTYIPFAFGLAILNAVTNILTNSQKNSANPVVLLSLIAFIAAIISLFVSLGVLIIMIASAQNKKITISETIQSIKKNALNYIVVSILCGLILFASGLAFLIPLFFVFPRILFAPYLVIDKGMEPMDAIKASWNGTAGHSGKVYGIIGASLLMALLIVVLVGIYFLFMYAAAIAILYTYIFNKK